MNEQNPETFATISKPATHKEFASPKGAHDNFTTILKPATPKGVRVGILVAGLVLSGAAVAGGTALLLRQRDLAQNLASKSPEALNKEIAALNQSLERSQDIINQTFENSGFSDAYFEETSKSAALEIEKTAREEALAEINAGETTAPETDVDVSTLETAPDYSNLSFEMRERLEIASASSLELINASNTVEADSLSLPINLLFLLAPLPTLAGVLLFFKLH